MVTDSGSNNSVPPNSPKMVLMLLKNEAKDSKAKPDTGSEDEANTS